MSRLSEPLVVSWLGVVAPTLQQSPLCSGAVKVFWDQPTVTNGADIKQATVCLQLLYHVTGISESD